MVEVFFSSLIWLVNTIFFILKIVIVLRIVLSWVNADPYNEIVRFIYSITEPIMAPFRNLPLQLGAIDFSPIIIFFILIFLNGMIVHIIAIAAGALLN